MGKFKKAQTDFVFYLNIKGCFVRTPKKAIVPKEAEESKSISRV